MQFYSFYTLTILFQYHIPACHISSEQNGIIEFHLAVSVHICGIFIDLYIPACDVPSEQNGSIEFHLAIPANISGLIGLYHDLSIDSRKSYFIQVFVICLLKGEPDLCIAFCGIRQNLKICSSQNTGSLYILRACLIAEAEFLRILCIIGGPRRAIQKVPAFHLDQCEFTLIIFHRQVYADDAGIHIHSDGNCHRHSCAS